MTPQQFVEMVARFTPTGEDDEDNKATLTRLIDEASTIVSDLPPPTGDVGELVMKARHRKRGTIYTIQGSAHLQTDTPLSDMAELIVYRSDHDGSLWVRQTAEFNDGRFDLLEEPPAADALTATTARIAELVQDKETAISIMGLNDRARDGLHDQLASANARAERLEAALREATPKFIDADLGDDCEYERCRDAYSDCSGELDRIKKLIDAALSPAPATDIQLPKGWLARELDGVAADVAQMSTGVRESLEEVVAASARDWTEDFALDNGNYFSRCVKCKSRLLGHKRRAVCKACTSPIPSEGGDDGKQ